MSIENRPTENLSTENLPSQNVAARIIDGRAIADAALADLSVRTRQFRDEAGHVPCLAAVIVGADPASKAYVQMKAKRSVAVGMTSRTVELPVSTTTEELVDVLRALSADPSIDGILLQHPATGHIDERAAFDAISADKDVDGVTSAAFAAMALTGGGFESCTPSGILRLLDATGVELTGKHAVVVGRSPILGLPMGMLLLRRGDILPFAHRRPGRPRRLGRRRHRGRRCSGTDQRDVDQAWGSGDRCGVQRGQRRRCGVRRCAPTCRCDHTGAGWRRPHDGGSPAGTNTGSSSSSSGSSGM